MKIEIEIRKSGDFEEYRADMKDLPGSPPLGLGSTPERAIANLFRAILLSETYNCYLTEAKLCEPLEIFRVIK